MTPLCLNKQGLKLVSFNYDTSEAFSLVRYLLEVHVTPIALCCFVCLSRCVEVRACPYGGATTVAGTASCLEPSVEGGLGFSSSSAK